MDNGRRSREEVSDFFLTKECHKGYGQKILANFTDVIYGWAQKKIEFMVPSERHNSTSHFSHHKKYHREKYLIEIFTIRCSRSTHTVCLSIFNRKFLFFKNDNGYASKSDNEQVSKMCATIR